MTLNDLLFLVSVIFVLVLMIRIAISALRRRFEQTRRLGKVLGVFVASYAVILMAVALARPRRFFAPGERRCFDDWCVSVIDARVADASNGAPCEGSSTGRTWVATVEVLSVAGRIRQRARDARAELEDRHGNRYAPCAAPLKDAEGLDRSLSGELGPQESFRVLLPFRLPNDREPEGLVVHHGDFPGVVIIGVDQSFLHTPALHRMVLETGR
jgi:hypothetical protein